MTPLVNIDAGAATSEGFSSGTQLAGRTGKIAGGGPSPAGTRQNISNDPVLLISFNSRYAGRVVCAAAGSGNTTARSVPTPVARSQRVTVCSPFVRCLR